MDLDALYAEINRYPLVARAATRSTGRKVKIVNELPLISQSVANAIATTAWGIASPHGQANIQKTIENSVKRKFLPYMNAYSQANRRGMHHMYEWGKVGNSTARLFDLKIPNSSRGKANFTMRLTYRPSRSLVPLSEAQATPNPNTGAVVEKRHIFYNKAMVMESGITVTVRPQKAKFMAFDNPPGSPPTLSGLTFTSKPVTIDYTKLPTYHGMEKALKMFFAGPGERDAGEAVQRYGRSVRKAAERASHRINIVSPSDSYARSVAASVSSALNPVI